MFKRKVKLITLVALCLCLTLLAGCAQINKAGQVLCNPTDVQKAEAQAAIVFLESTLALVGKGEMQATVDLAIGIFQFVRAGICVTAQQVKDALAAVDQVDAVVQGQAAVRGVLKKAPAVKPELKALRAWVN